jgi:TctA family transporter
MTNYKGGSIMNVKEFKTKVKNWWNDNKKLVGVGFAGALLGVTYGFVKGVNAVATTVVLPTSLINERSNDENEEFVYDETNVDDPELLEMIRDGSIEE